MTETFNIPEAVSIALAVTCAICSAVFSGLTLGLLTLDLVQLKLIINKEDKNREEERQAKYASRILPLRQDGNLLLVTLLIGNVAVNSAFSILLGNLTDELFGLLISTVVITLFGEIIPQAFCAKYGLVVGGNLARIVWVIEILLYPIVKPIATVLNYLLGADIGTMYDKRQLKALVDFHDDEFHVLNKEEARILKGGLDFAFNKVVNCMTPIHKVFGLDINSMLNVETAISIIQAGYSRIPVFDYSKPQSVVGILFIRDLLFIDLSHEISIKNIIALIGRNVYAVDHDATLLSVLSDFKKGHTHLAVVRRTVSDTDFDPFYEHIGIITLEDILEEILQDEIHDEFDGPKTSVFGLISPKCRNEFDITGNNLSESDEWINNKGEEELEMTSMCSASLPIKNLRSDQYALTLLGRMKLFDKNRGLNPLDDSESLAISFFLSSVEKLFSSKYLCLNSLHETIKGLPVYKLDVHTPIYTKGNQSDAVVIILQGSITMRSDVDNYECVYGPWSVLGTKCLAIPHLLSIKEHFSIHYEKIKLKENQRSKGCILKKIENDDNIQINSIIINMFQDNNQSKINMVNECSMQCVKDNNKRGMSQSFSSTFSTNMDDDNQKIKTKKKLCRNSTDRKNSSSGSALCGWLFKGKNSHNSNVEKLAHCDIAVCIDNEDDDKLYMPNDSKATEHQILLYNHNDCDNNVNNCDNYSLGKNDTCGRNNNNNNYKQNYSNIYNVEASELNSTPSLHLISSVSPENCDIRICQINDKTENKRKPEISHSYLPFLHTDMSSTSLIDLFDETLKQMIEKYKFISDFSAFVSDSNCMLICIHRCSFLKAVRASIFDSRINENKHNDWGKSIYEDYIPSTFEQKYC